MWRGGFINEGNRSSSPGSSITSCNYSFHWILSAVQNKILWKGRFEHNEANRKATKPLQNKKVQFGCCCWMVAVQQRYSRFAKLSQATLLGICSQMGKVLGQVALKDEGASQCGSQSDSQGGSQCIESHLQSHIAMWLWRCFSRWPSIMCLSRCLSSWLPSGSQGGSQVTLKSKKTFSLPRTFLSSVLQRESAAQVSSILWCNMGWQTLVRSIMWCNMGWQTLRALGLFSTVLPKENLSASGMVNIIVKIIVVNIIVNIIVWWSTLRAHWTFPSCAPQRESAAQKAIALVWHWSERGKDSLSSLGSIRMLQQSTCVVLEAQQT